MTICAFLNLDTSELESVDDCALPERLRLAGLAVVCRVEESEGLRAMRLTTELLVVERLGGFEGAFDAGA